MVIPFFSLAKSPYSILKMKGIVPNLLRRNPCLWRNVPYPLTSCVMQVPCISQRRNGRQAQQLQNQAHLLRKASMWQIFGWKLVWRTQMLLPVFLVTMRCELTSSHLHPQPSLSSLLWRSVLKKKGAGSRENIHYRSECRIWESVERPSVNGVSRSHPFPCKAQGASQKRGQKDFLGQHTGRTEVKQDFLDLR